MKPISSRRPTLLIFLASAGLAFAQTEKRRMMDFDKDGWDDLWAFIHSHSYDGRSFLNDLQKNPNGDADMDGISNINEMKAMTSPWPPPVKKELTAEEKKQSQKVAAVAAEQTRAALETWRQLVRDTTRPAFKTGEPDADFIRHDNAEWRARAAAERDSARLDQWRVELELNAIALKYGFDRHGLERGTLVGDSPDGPVFMIPQDALSARTINADDLWPINLSIWQRFPLLTRNLTGAGIRVSMWEAGQSGSAGILTTHAEFNGGRVVQIDSAVPGDHATAVAGMIVGGGILDVYQNGTHLGKALRGIAYEGGLDGHDLIGFSDEIVDGALKGQSFSNHSYSEGGGWEQNGSGRWRWEYPNFTEDPRLGLYSSGSIQGISSAQLDAFVASNQTHLPVFSAGNANNGGPGQYVNYQLPDDSSPGTPRDWTNGDDGFDTVRAPGTAKNVLTVGACMDLTGGAWMMTRFSGTGPTDDGRIKPDVLAVGQRDAYINLLYSLFAPHRAGSTAYYNGVTKDATGQVDIQGTSLAAPCVTGGLMLAEQRRKQLLPTAGPLLASTWRAAAIHTARDASSGPDFRQGWGIFNAEALVTLLEDDKALGRGSLIKEFTISTGAAKSFYVTVPRSGGGILTLAWSDPAGSPSPYGSVVDPPASMLVNDLDLIVQDMATGALHLPWILDPDLALKRAAVRIGQATRGADHLNNVEVVSIPSTEQALRLKVTVSPYNALRGGSQKISLILRGVVLEKPANIAAGFTGHPANPNEYAITFRSDPGAWYTLQTSTSLAGTGSWSDVSSSKAEDGTTTFLTTRNPAERRRFWRVRRGS